MYLEEMSKKNCRKLDTSPALSSDLQGDHFRHLVPFHHHLWRGLSAYKGIETCGPIDLNTPL